MAKRPSRFQHLRARAEALLEGRGLRPEEGGSRWHRFVHFWVLVARSFSRNRCPVRASALAYATLLALIPMLAVVMSITSTFLKKEGEAGIEKFIVRFVASVTPPSEASTNAMEFHRHRRAAATSTNEAALPPEPPPVAAVPEVSEQPEGVVTNAAAGVAAEEHKAAVARHQVARNINQFIQNTRSGALGITGSILLIFAGISMLSRIEATFNDIWGVVRGRSWFMRVVLYWGVLSLGPMLLIVALGLASGPQLEGPRKFLSTLPLVGTFLFHFGFQLLPVLVLCLTFAAFYMLMPNTRVDWRAALVGGLVSALLFHLNNLISVLYVSRVVSNSKIYGSLGLVPVFMIGLYFSWLILLFGAQVAYAYQNRSAYVEEKQVENINQRGREFVALRLMTLIGQRYLEGALPATLAEMGEQLCVPTRLVRQLMQTLCGARLVAEIAGPEPAYVPARPMEQINCHDILLALRAGQGQELSTRDEPSRMEVYGEFRRIQEAERAAAASVTMLALANRARNQLEPCAPKALE